MASFYVARHKTSRTGWRLMKEEWVAGLRRQASVPRIAWSALGFTDSMSIEDARARVRQLNAENSVVREEQRRVTAIAARVERDRLHHSAFVPDDLNQRFIKWLEENVAPKQVEKTKIVWGTAKQVLIKLQVTAEQMAGSKRKIYQYLSASEYSYAYSKQLIRLMNQYREFVGRMTGRYFEKLPTPKGHDREMINDAYLDSDSFLGASEPLTPEILQSIQSYVKSEQYQWLFCTVWLGLRPSEVEMIIEDREKKYWRVEPGDTDVLWVYQPKLTSKPRAQRWKPIPIIYREQEEALGILLNGIAAKPLTRTLKRLTGRQITLYGGRKGFTDLMLDRGQRLEDVAQWLGHSSIEMTWSHYKSRTNVSYLKAGC